MSPAIRSNLAGTKAAQMDRDVCNRMIHDTIQPDTEGIRTISAFGLWGWSAVLQQEPAHTNS